MPITCCDNTCRSRPTSPPNHATRTGQDRDPSKSALAKNPRLSDSREVNFAQALRRPIEPPVLIRHVDHLRLTRQPKQSRSLPTSRLAGTDPHDEHLDYGPPTMRELSQAEEKSTC